MGIWTESCALTGLEIREGAPAWLLHLFEMPHPETGRHVMVCPPVLGSYDGTGGLVLDEDVPSLELRAGDAIGPGSMAHPKARPAFIHPEVLEFLPNIEGEGGVPLGHIIDERLEHIRDATDFAPSGPVIDLEDREIHHSDVGPAIDLSKRMHPEISFANGFTCFMARRHPDPDRFERLLQDYERAWLIRSAEVVLRRRLVPEISAPNEGGNAAVRAMAIFTQGICDRSLFEDTPSP